MQINEALVDPHLVSVPGFGTLSARGLSGGDSQDLGWHAHWPLDLQRLLLCTFDQVSTHCKKHVSCFIPQKIFLPSLEYLYISCDCYWLVGYHQLTLSRESLQCLHLFPGSSHCGWSEWCEYDGWLTPQQEPCRSLWSVTTTMEDQLADQQWRKC